MDEDQQAIADVLAGAAEAFRGLVERHQRRVWTFAKNMLRNDADADDLVQEVFVAAFRNLSSFDARRALFSTWLLTIARNRCCTMMQSRVQATACDELPDCDPPPETAVSDSEIWLWLDGALAKLPIEQRSTFVLAEIQELSHREIAAIEGVEVGTVKSRLSRAKASLRSIFRHEVSGQIVTSQGTPR
jgi:RNA polymerase sigma-70 factor (ECF subfamily)